MVVHSSIISSMKSSNSEKLSITLPVDLNRQLQKFAKQEHRSLSGLIQEASRYYLNIRKYEGFQQELAEKARKLGLRDEQGVLDLIEQKRRTKP